MSDLTRRAARAHFEESRTPGARKAFRSLVSTIAAIDNRSTTEEDDFAAWGVMHSIWDGADEPSIFPMLKRVFPYALEWPKELRVRTSPRLDLTGAETYGDVARTTYLALREAAMPELIRMAGPLAPADAKDWRPKLD